MAIRLVPFREEYTQPLQEFNARLRAGGVPYQFPGDSATTGSRRTEAGEARYVAVDRGVVRGAYILLSQPFWLGNRIREIGCLRLPVSEGVLDRRYIQVGAQLFMDAVRRQPLLYGLGIGGMQEPAVRVMQALGWAALPVPFHFRVVRPRRFFREIRYLRTTPARRGLLDVLRISGIGGLGVRIAQAAVRRRPPAGPEFDVEVVDRFGPSCDPLWTCCRDDYAMIGVRDAAALAMRYPEGNRFVRLRIVREGEIVGWVVLLATRMSEHRQFGGMRVGTIVDCLADAPHAERVIDAATEQLERMGVDLIVSNQSAAPWCRALQRCGYLRGPSNFVFAASRDLARMLDPLSANLERVHLTRGDGEGPRNL